MHGARRAGRDRGSRRPARPAVVVGRGARRSPRAPHLRDRSGRGLHQREGRSRTRVLHPLHHRDGVPGCPGFRARSPAEARMRRRLVMVVLGCALTVPASAQAGVQKLVLTENDVSVSRMDPGDGFTDCVGYRGYVREDRQGLWKVTVGKTDGHVEGTVHARIRFAPAPGTSGVVYAGTYVEHDVGRFVPGPDGDLPSPNAMFRLQGTAAGDDGSRMSFTMTGQTHLDVRTGETRRERFDLHCSVR